VQLNCNPMAGLLRANPKVLIEMSTVLKRISNSNWLSSRFPFYYGWVMLPIAILAQAATSPGQTFGVSIFNPSLREALNISHSQLTGAYMFGTLLAAIPQPFIGAQMDRFGIRKIMTWATIFLGLACIFMSQVQSVVMLFVAFFLLRLFGQGALSLLASNIPAMWFQQKLGRVSGMINLGFSGSTAILPPLILGMIQQYGWRWTYASLGFAVWVLLLPSLLFFFRNRPEDVGQLLDGTAGKLHQNGISKSSSRSLDLKTAQRTPAYWIMLVLTALWAMMVTGIFFNIIPIFTSLGLTAAQAAATYTTLAITTAITQLLAGLLADKAPLNWLVSIGVAFMVAAIFTLVNTTQPWMGQAYAILLGLTQGLLGIVSGTLWARYYGRKHLGKIRGSVFTAGVAGSSVGPFVMGWIFDRFGSYQISLWIFIGLLAPMVIAALWAKPPKQRVLA
jgi:MFS family permease